MTSVAVLNKKSSAKAFIYRIVRLLHTSPPLTKPRTARRVPRALRCFRAPPPAHPVQRLCNPRTADLSRARHNSRSPSRFHFPPACLPSRPRSFRDAAPPPPLAPARRASGLIMPYLLYLVPMIDL